MNFIRTVLGDISPEELGICDSHEHLIRSGGPELREGMDFLLDSLEAAKYEVNQWEKVGGKSIVCMEAIGCGRNVPKMLELAEEFRGRIHFLMTTGFLKGSVYDERVDFLATVPVDEIVEMIVKEITEGMDIHSYNGPIVKRTKARAGLVKGGASYGVITKMDEKILQIAALTQKATGCPIEIHTQQGTMGLEICDLLKKYGANLENTIICHLQKNPDKYYHKAVLDKGVYLCYDGPDRVKYYPDNIHAENLKWLVDKGYEDKILLSMDAGRASYQSGYMKLKGSYTLGISYLMKRFIPLLKEVGISEEAINKFMTENPSRAFTFNC